jgi:hypothetical protein
MKTRVKMLKVKVKSLAEESRIIRAEEHRAGKDELLRGILHSHRVCEVRREQRASLLAYGFLRGVEYAAIEAKTETPPDWNRVAKLVGKFGSPMWESHPDRKAQDAAFADWKEKAASVAA